MKELSARVETFLPAPGEPGIATILQGLCRATGASRCELTLRLLRSGITATYETGPPSPGQPTVVALNVGSGVGGSCAVFGARGTEQGGRAALEIVLPILEAAVAALIGRCGNTRQLEIVTRVLDQSGTAVLILDADGNLIFENDAAARLAAEPGGDATNPFRSESSATLLAIVQAGVAARGHARADELLFPVKLPGRPTLEARAVPLDPGSADSMQIVTLRGAAVPSAEHLRYSLAHHGISRREAEVLSHLLSGLRCSDVAKAMGISDHTVRDHLKHLHSKLGVHSRTQLMARLALAGFTTT